MATDALALATSSQDPNVAELLVVLRSVGMSDREIRTWLSSGTAWLGGAVPIERAATDSAGVLKAAQRFASNF
jgi:hypothetical protein